MNINNHIILHPEVVKLAENIQMLKNELSRNVVEYDFLKYTIKENLETEYYTKVGYVELIFLEITASVNRLKREIELRTAAINRGEILTKQQIDEQIEREYKKWLDEITAMQQKIDDAEKFLNSPKLSTEDSLVLRNEYFTLAKRFHPDVNPDISDDDKKMWNQIVDAYKNGDVQALKGFSIISENLPLQTENSGLESLTIKKETIMKTIRDYISKIDALQSEFPFTFKEKLKNTQWITQTLNELNTQIEELKEREIYLDSILQELTREE